jgi:hypothetical protein
MLVNFAQSQKIERAACERALPAGVKDTPDGASVRCWAESPDQYRTTTMMAMTMIAAISSRFDGDYRPRSCFPAFRPWFLLGRLEFAAKPLANAGFHWVLRYRRRLNTTALLALKCSAVEASGSRLDLGEKHSLVIARRAARPLNRRKVGRGDRLIFAHGASLR